MIHASHVSDPNLIQHKTQDGTHLNFLPGSAAICLSAEKSMFENAHDSMRLRCCQLRRCDCTSLGSLFVLA